MIKAIDSLAEQSIRNGCKNLRVVYRTDRHVKGLIRAGILPEGCLLGRMKLFGLPYLTRVAINVPVSFLVTKEEEIKEWVEDYTEDFPDDVFNALIIASIIAGSNGYWKMASMVGHRILARVGVMPDTASKSRILRDPESLLALVKAD